MARDQEDLIFSPGRRIFVWGGGGVIILLLLCVYKQSFEEGNSAFYEEC